MDIKKVDLEDKDLIEDYLDIPISEIREVHNRLVFSYDAYLKDYGVKKLWRDELPDDCSDEEFISLLDAKELQLIFLYKHLNCLVHKDLVSAFVRKYIKDAALDQQVRHLGSQYFWYVLNKGAKIPNADMIVPSGYNYLVSIEMPNPKAVAEALKRTGRLAARNFTELKLAYANKCATCGIEEGKKDPRNELIVSLQQGHMTPRKPLTLENTIPQCQYCNQTYKDYFQFNEFGRVIAVNNPLILLKSPKDVQDEMITVLLKERENQ
ncbi:MAG: hypothetical protein IJX98_00255 [Clostridia bacterium]|nr:hypothetical protein [Clostridia bacterium]